MIVLLIWIAFISYNAFFNKRAKNGESFNRDLMPFVRGAVSFVIALILTLIFK